MMGHLRIFFKYQQVQDVQNKDNN